MADNFSFFARFMWLLRKYQKRKYYNFFQNITVAATNYVIEPRLSPHWRFTTVNQVSSWHWFRPYKTVDISSNHYQCVVDTIYCNEFVLTHSRVMAKRRDLLIAMIKVKKTNEVHIMWNLIEKQTPRVEQFDLFWVFTAKFY